jgi:ferredoxin
MTLAWMGVIGSLAPLVVLTMRGVDLLLAAPVCARSATLRQSWDSGRGEAVACIRCSRCWEYCSRSFFFRRRA